MSRELPGPRRPPLLQLQAWLWNPTSFLEQCRARFGPVFRLRIGGWADLAIVADARLARELMNDTPGQMETGAANELMRPLVGDHSIFVLDGQRHRALRRSLAPLFSAAARAPLEPMLLTWIQEELAGFGTLSGDAATSMLRHLSCRATWHFIAGRDDPASKGLAEPLVRALGPRAALAAFAGNPLRQLIGGPVKRAIEAIDQVIDTEIAAQECGLEELGGIIGTILADETLSIRERRAIARDNARSLLVAGGDTTASAGAWLTALALGERNPEYLRLRAAVQAGNRTYIEATITEALRLGPVVEVISRRAARDFECDSYRFRAGDLISPCPYLIHRDPNIYPEPLRFAPDRFIGKTPAPEAYMPFGTGSRRCLGFAVATSVLAAWTTALVEAGLVAWGTDRLHARRRNVTLSPRPESSIAQLGLPAP